MADGAVRICETLHRGESALTGVAHCHGRGSTLARPRPTRWRQRSPLWKMTRHSACMQQDSAIALDEPPHHRSRRKRREPQARGPRPLAPRTRRASRVPRRPLPSPQIESSHLAAKVRRLGCRPLHCALLGDGRSSSTGEGVTYRERGLSHRFPRLTPTPSHRVDHARIGPWHSCRARTPRTRPL